MIIRARPGQVNHREITMSRHPPHPFDWQRSFSCVVFSCVVAVSLLIAISCSKTVEEPSETPTADRDEVFIDHTARSGLDFVHFNGMTGELLMTETVGSGGALFDYDNDGDLDLYLVQGEILGIGKSIDDALFPPRHPLPLSDRLYRNELEAGQVRFVDVTEESGLAESALGYGMGVAAGDYDNDGWIDLYVTRIGPNLLLANNGDGVDGRVTFSDRTAAAGVDDERFSVPAVFFDADRDGWLDLWVGNYVDFPEEDPPSCFDATGAQDYCGPDVFKPLTDRFFRNRGPGPDGRVTFEDATASAALGSAAGPSLGVLAVDFDDDGDLDLYVANDSKPNFMWMNQGGSDGPAFTDEALLAGTAVNATGQAEGSMGVDAADFDRDGDLDLFLTHFVTESNTLYLNRGQGLFDDVTPSTGLGPPSRVYTSFGTAAIDYDNDGWEDLLVLNGAVNRIEALARQGDPFPLHQPNQLFRNLGVAQPGQVRFEDVTERSGSVFERSEVSRGAIFGDVDNDGDLDVVVANNNGPARLLVNTTGQSRPWLGLRLVGGTGAQRDMYGARAAVLRGGEPLLWRRLRTDGSYCSANDPRVLFGLGGAEPSDGVRVLWPDGSTEDFSEVVTGRYTTLIQGTGD